MKKVLKWTLAVVVSVSLGMSVVSCSNDEGGNEIEQRSIKSVKENHLEKDWIAAHFEFTESCKGAARFAYQVSAVHISLKGKNFKAVDKYSLKEDRGTWLLDNDVIVVDSEEFGQSFTFKIKELKNNSLYVDVIGHDDITAIELVTFTP
ncbi:MULTISPECIES: hypothetical protein [unclassified Myroides]|uniref:hypothetical protein n=1 Tax=unclassified Myroides TaxID=2642485 RepID=UPI0015FB49D5|nr:MULTISPECIES: hypothetical protein [unclassified Myroides]MBB1150761.1 hypothetical protein [Myroides sp. NP-2]MDM1407593.1 hypothetical protein [Myroides sp. DF42-4-2]